MFAVAEETSLEEAAIPAPQITSGARVIPIDMWDRRFRHDQRSSLSAPAYPLPEDVPSLLRSASAAGAENEAPHAHWIHRSLASALDISMVLCAMGIFLGLLLLADVPVTFSLSTVPVYAAATLLLWFLYDALWCIVDTDSPGCQWVHLELLDFDGNRATSSHRWKRLFGQYLSLLSAGLGLLWSLVDDYGMSWHDYISQSYLTPSPELLNR